MNTENRPNPDALLARVHKEESKSHRGKLKIFFGYAAGVGKTFAMLEAARREKASGVDVVVGYVEPHGRIETESQVVGMEVIPYRLLPYRGVDVQEFDLDAGLKRHPELILVDELAHTNVEGSRHTKRWQDIEELLEAGIDVWTTLNVQHLESLNDVIAQITGVIVRETLPDAILEKADDFELVDLPPEELIERLQAGKVYQTLQAQRALQHFFQQSNLTALRELAMRQVANRLHREVDAAHQQKNPSSPWASGDRVLVCVSPSPTTIKLIRTGRRMATALGAEWLAVAVQTGGEDPSRGPFREAIGQHFRLAQQLGAETHILIGENVSQTILEYARSRNVTKIIIGKTAQPVWKRLLFGTVIDHLLDHSGDIDVYVIQGEAEVRPPRSGTRPTIVQPPPNYLATAGVVAISTIAGLLSHLLKLAEANIAMIFLLGVVIAATRFGRGPAIFAAVLNVLIFDFFFVPPYLSFSVGDAQYLFTFAVMLGIGLLISTLTARTRDRLKASQQQEQRTAALYRLTRQLSEVVGTEFLVRCAGQQLTEIFSAEVVIFLRQEKSGIEIRFGENTSIAKLPVNAVVAQWVMEHDQIAGDGTDTLPNASALFVPLTGSQKTVGSIGVRSQDLPIFSDPGQRRLLETCCSLIALSLERDQSLLDANQAQLQVETEQLRNSLLSSVSHDLRTPLAAIAGAGSGLLEPSVWQNESIRQEFLQSIIEESHRLTRLVDNLLDMTRLESGKLTLNRQWHVLEEIVGSSLRYLRRELVNHPVQVNLASDLPLLWIDDLLMEQLFVNLLENSIRYTPEGTAIEISATATDRETVIRVADRGPGLPQNSEGHIFEKFFRGTRISPDGRRGVGLGLAVCEGIAVAHGGTITAGNRVGGGAEFIVRIPTIQKAPAIRSEERSSDESSRPTDSSGGR